jgi:hypothetical protein
MNDLSNGNKRAILRSTFSVKESMPVLRSLSAARSSPRQRQYRRVSVVAIGIEGWPLRLDFLGRKSVYAAHQRRCPLAFVS